MSITLSEEQQHILDLFTTGNNIFITGPGGSGKTFLINYIYQLAQIMDKNIQVCALTGCAAILLKCNAKTIHSWACIGLGTGDINTIVNKVVNNKYKRKNWSNIKVLIIDEVSMMSSKLLTILDSIAKKVKNNNSPFGGIQVVFSGDFYQLPPIREKNVPESYMFCFENPLWEELFNHQIHLNKIFRQSDEEYCSILNQIRQGTLTKKAYNILMSRCITCTDDIKPTKLLPTRFSVNKINEDEMRKIESNEHTYLMEVIKILPNKQEFNSNTSANTNKSANTSTNMNKLSQQELELHINSYKSNLLAENELKLKIGSQVMCIVNIEVDDTNPIVNGSRGIVVNINENGLPVVKFKSGITRVMNYHIWEIDDTYGYGIKQIPLILAWAITIHKSQGTTLDLAEIDIGSGIFECGQSYVALSRIKNVEGLYLSSFNPSKIKVNKKAQEYYSRFNR